MSYTYELSSEIEDGAIVITLYERDHSYECDRTTAGQVKITADDIRNLLWPNKNRVDFLGRDG